MSGTTVGREALKDALAHLDELDAAARGQYLQDLAGRDPALHAALQPWLPGLAGATFGAPGRAALDAAARELVDGADALAPAGAEGLRLGPWRLSRPLGRGGMGVVWAGERDDGRYHQAVAVKLLPPLAASEAARERFARETRALARLSHPHVARLLDAGQGADGTAWLVMERVDGLPLTAHADQAGLDLRERLGLMLQLCAAVAHAHRQLLVHRDLKPANVLVDPREGVKLLDFGVAAMLAEDDGPAPARLTRGFGAFTPGYAAPEQLRGEPAGTPADVFALGALLQELVSGAHPFIADGDTLARTVERTLREEPAAPSRAPRALRGVDRDLDAVIAHALRKDPAERLPSAEALAEELQAWLDGRPVRSRPVGWGTRVWKGLRRHRGLSLTALAGLIGTLGFAVHAQHQARLAQARFDQVRAIARQVIHDYNGLLAPLPGTLPVRRRLVDDALHYLDALADEAGDDPGLRAELAAGYAAIGDVQGRGAADANLGDIDGATRSYARAGALWQGLCAGPDAAPGGTARDGACLELGLLREREGDLLAGQGRLEEAARALGAADAALAALPLASLEAAAQAERLQARADVLTKLGSLAARGRGAVWTASLDHARAQVALAERIRALTVSAAAAASSPAAGGGLTEADRPLALARQFLANRLLAMGQADAALSAARDAHAVLERLGAGEGASGAARIEAVTAAAVHAEALLLADRSGEARSLLQAAWQRLQDMVARDPQNLMLRGRLAQMGRRLAAAQSASGDPAATVRTMEAVLAASADFTPRHALFIQQRWFAQQEGAEALLRLGRAEAAWPHARAAAEGLGAQATAGIGGARTAVQAAQAARIAARVAQARGDTDAAAAWARAALAPLQARVDDTPGDADARWALARLWADAAAGLLPLPDAAAGDAARERDAQWAALRDAGALAPAWARQAEKP